MKTDRVEPEVGTDRHSNDVLPALEGRVLGLKDRFWAWAATMDVRAYPSRSTDHATADLPNLAAAERPQT